MRGLRRGAAVLGAVAAAMALSAAPAVAGRRHGDDPGGHCARQDRVAVPGAEVQRASCLADLTTAGTVASGHTVPGDYAGLHAAGTVNPTGVPGVQVDGYFPDTSTGNTNNGWNHDSQFVLRFPDRWNGGLVVTGAPGVRRQYALDVTISDWVLARGYAFAATDKGNTGATFYRDGARPGDAVREWNRRVTQLTVAAKVATAQRYGHPPRRTYMTGLSNGGYLTRWQLENVPGLYDGGVDWEGTLFRAAGPNLLTYLPTALREYPRYVAGDATARDRMIGAGFSPGSEFLWPIHYQVYWDLTQRIYREEFDPDYDGATEAGTPYCAGRVSRVAVDAGGVQASVRQGGGGGHTGVVWTTTTTPPVGGWASSAPRVTHETHPSGTPGCDADYDYASRPDSVHRAVARVQNTGRIGRPMLTLHGTVDSLLPRETDSDVYTRLVAAAGRSGLHRYYVIEGGNHVDSFYGFFPDRLRPILPCYRDAFTALEAWVERGSPPPPSRSVPRGAGDVVNSCSLAG